MNKQKTDRFPNPVNPDRVLANNLYVESVVNELGDKHLGVRLRKPISPPYCEQKSAAAGAPQLSSKCTSVT